MQHLSQNVMAVQQMQYSKQPVPEQVPDMTQSNMYLGQGHWVYTGGTHHRPCAQDVQLTCKPVHTTHPQATPPRTCTKQCPTTCRMAEPVRWNMLPQHQQKHINYTETIRQKPQNAHMHVFTNELHKSGHRGINCPSSIQRNAYGHTTAEQQS